MTTRYKGRITAHGALRRRIPEGTLVEFTLRPEGDPGHRLVCASFFINNERAGGLLSFAGDEAGIEPLEPLPWEAHS